MLCRRRAFADSLYAAALTRRGRVSRRSKLSATGQAGNCTSHARTVNGAEKTWLKSMRGGSHQPAVSRDLLPTFFKFQLSEFAEEARFILDALWDGG